MLIFNSALNNENIILSVTPFERFFNLLVTLFIITAMGWFNETSKSNLMRKLEITETKLRKLSMEDPLTGAYNRRSLFSNSDRSVGNGNGYDGGTSVLLLDIDHFKSVNDNYGHLIGDQVLINLVTQVKGLLRQKDSISRFGGEEFVVLLPDTQLEDAFKIAERMRAHIEQSPFKTDSGILTITVSIGVAWVQEPSTKLDGVIREADNALYRAKKNGRNRVEVCRQL